ncbi:MAG: hypothetical protein IKM48_00705 [Clostridia bacterium]|nr:hypothetical protein [Clostridia bacterium]
MSGKKKEEQLNFWQKYKFYFIGFIGAFLLIGSMSVQNIILAYKTADGTQYAAKLDYSAYGICLRCYGTTDETTDIVEKELFFMNNREKSVRNAASALQEIAGEEGGLMQVRVGGLLGNNKKNTAKMVEYLEGLGYKAVAIE